jgi:hypothetical protein
MPERRDWLGGKDPRSSSSKPLAAQLLDTVRPHLPMVLLRSASADPNPDVLLTCQTRWISDQTQVATNVLA